MRKTELIERIEKLEQVVEFLSKYDKDEIVFEISFCFGIIGTSAKYLYQGAIKTTQILCPCCEVIKQTEKHIIVKGDWLGNKPSVIKKYYQIDKATAEVQEIQKPAFVLEQELSEKEAVAKKEKGSGNKKRTKGGEQAK